MPYETWRQRWHRIIQDSLAEGQRQGYTGKDLRDFVRMHKPKDSYGSYSRRMWFEEYRYLVRGKPRPQRSPVRRVEPAAGQGELFGGEL